MTVNRTIYKVIMVNKAIDAIIVEAYSCANDTAIAIANVAVAHAKEIAGKDVYTYVTSVVSYSKEVA